jgi:alkylhydroperoxidase family enzyme
MDSLQDVEWLEPLVEARVNPELVPWVKKHAGTEYPHTAYLADCPWMLHADVYLDEAYIHITDIAALIYLVVSRDNSCRFCYGAIRMLMRLQGMSESEIERLERDVETAAVDPKLKLALDYARRVSRATPAPGEAEKQALRDVGYDDVAIMEIAFQSVDVIFHNRMSTLLALPLDDESLLEDKGVIELMREQFAQLFTQINTPSKPEKLTDALKTGPYSNVVVALDGIVQARILRTIVDEAWASPHLPTRTKALIFAVIARGLGSRPAETESYRLLEQEGLDSGQVDEILAHLASPVLDDAESRILPYVRDTIWYQTPTAQRRGRELRTQMTNEQFLETVGIAALANMVCRLPLVIDVA